MKPPKVLILTEHENLLGDLALLAEMFREFAEERKSLATADTWTNGFGAGLASAYDRAAGLILGRASMARPLELEEAMSRLAYSLIADNPEAWGRVKARNDHTCAECEAETAGDWTPGREGFEYELCQDHMNDVLAAIDEEHDVEPAR